jgi:inhibitor of the pro-sigma K processing machinery
VDLSQKILAGLLALFFLLALLRIFRSPLRLAVKVLGNTLLGFLALWGLNLSAALTGVTLGLNLWNALVIGILGLPGLVLLLLTQWVLR